MSDKIKKDIEKMYNEYVLLTDNIVALFEEKHGVTAEHNIDREVYFFGDDALNISDIRYDVFYHCPEGMIFDWLDYNNKWMAIDAKHVAINLRAWHKGCPRKSEADYATARERYEYLMKKNAELLKMIDEMNNRTKLNAEQWEKKTA